MTAIVNLCAHAPGVVLLPAVFADEGDEDYADLRFSDGDVYVTVNFGTKQELIDWLHAALEAARNATREEAPA